ncbi:4-hydroxy-3-methylbut-2-enyl diphosphate reductase [Achromatium sp. WMS2]|nr:4-hydroxy-3-methylbut-2-enyl diphosphate reductase [Achromatium sp. WMS2]
MEVILANPRGFCAGVDRAIEIVEQALAQFGPPIYVRHEVVHNRFVVNRLRHNGAIFVDDLAQIPDGNTVIFSAHGVPQSVRAAASKRNLRVFDATCPLVTKVHLQVARHCREGHTIILIGHKGHPEVEGTLGQCKDYDKIYLVETLDDVTALQIQPSQHIAFVTQTTLSVDDAAKIVTALQQKFPNITGPRKSDICYATQNRQNAVRELAQQCDIVLVVGSLNSSNSNRLRELAAYQGKLAFLIDGPEDIQQSWLKDAQTIGITAGASAPEILVEQVLNKLKDWGITKVREQLGKEESIVFALPLSLRTNGQ